ncbi:U11/U12 small nuclear ribonucleoprotein 59 kDa protein isoform X2 [Cynara cardunculus var. scolymus]|uniref:U11/U12 small nuclear ribonucleoprotein 59 kDa protein isoform X2 n=1 Tax=Cynara cardunculus var. scolymus TaxID=59895 RepID=UPI000D62ABAC|nr:U11/U12 small nuclear ribonucleoprotein 59 kDa protein isoform X2 [Cynara cardunculus var. scolymus]
MQLYNSIAKGLREVDTRLQRYYKVIVCMNMMMRPMNPPPFQPIAPAPWFPPLPPLTSSFWNATNVHGSLKELQNTLELAEAMEKELEMLITIKGGNQHLEQTEDKGCETAMGRFLKLLENNRITLDTQEKISVEAANALMAKLKNEVEPFKVISDDKTPWEEKSTAVRLANKMQKHKRNKLWRKRKRRRIGEMIAKELEQFEQADQEADEWRASEIAKEIAGRKVEKMKEIAKQKAKEERRRLESELELVLIVEKLQELRSIRIQKLTKQGHFLPEEDNKFLERIRAAVEEEERQAMAAADTGAAKEAIATAEESRNITSVPALNSEDQISVKDGDKASQEKITEIEAKGGSSAAADTESRKQESQVPVPSRGYDYSASLPLEFYHYYHGSSTDMGTLIEVRRTWDAYIRPGGSRIPGHWVQPPPPADEIWASYLVKPR